MKITIFATVALTAVVGMAFADEMFNNWNNNNGWDNDDGFGGASFGGISQISGGGFGQQVGYGSGYGSGYGYASGYGSGYGKSLGYGKGYGVAQASYIPVPAMPKTGGSGNSFLSIFALLFLLPLLFNRSSSQDQIILLNSTLEG
ncbi:sulfur globule protein CV1-like [Mercenaria mercenaria]|uniref:sulfur globule protein CV1-like n=1 Tax=Mercenaria mercenaria TaxID=6596 RepID=UPI00234FAE88|nr:sulfur globule protein CV1-like [Mercenaria mercenaria]